MRKLDSTDFWSLSDRWIFMDISTFFIEASEECIMDMDGQGQYLYIDKNCQIYDSEEYIDFEELQKYFSDDMEGIDKLIKDKSNNEYTLFGVFWFNK